MRIQSLVLLASLVIACGDGGAGAPSGSAGGSAKKSAAPAASASSKPSAAPAASSAAAPGKPAVLGMCTNKDAGMCKEYVGVLGTAVEETCAGADKKGVFKKGSEECTHENSLGTCEVKVEGGGEFDHYYKVAGMDEKGAKAACELKSGTWVPEAAGASSASPATSGAPSAAPSAAPK